MAKVGHFYNNSAHTLNTAATTAYAVARSHNLTGLGTSNQGVSNKGYMLRTLYIKLDTISSGPAPTTLTVRLTRDAAGNDTVVGDVTASITFGVTATTTEGAVTIAIDFAYSHNDTSQTLVNNLHCFWKLDAGTANVRRIELVTEE
jgi:hypothetical protein